MGFWLLLACLVEPAIAWRAPPRAPLRLIDVCDAPEHYIDRVLDVDVVEPMWSSEPNARNEHWVEIPELGSQTFALVIDGPAFAPPFRARGEFMRRGDRPTWFFRAGGREAPWQSYVLHVTSIAPLPEEPLLVLTSEAELFGNAAHFDRRRVVYEGAWVTGFETSSLDRHIWLSFDHGTKIVGTLPPRRDRNDPGLRWTTQRVRATGLLFAHPGALYGHMGGYQAELHASKLEMLAGDALNKQ
jgi:hypothetical protein